MRIDIAVAILISTEGICGPYTVRPAVHQQRRRRRPDRCRGLELLSGLDGLPKTHALSCTIEHDFTTLHSPKCRDCATFFQADRICPGRSDLFSGRSRRLFRHWSSANLHGNDEWENDHEVHIVETRDASLPVEPDRVFPVASSLLRLGRRHMRVKLYAGPLSMCSKPVGPPRPSGFDRTHWLFHLRVA